MALADDTAAADRSTTTIQLPVPRYDSTTSLEDTLRRRRSVRTFGRQPLALGEVAQLLWAAQGISDTADDKRTAPSAGATYPLEVFLVAGNVEGLPPGVYRYRPRRHDLALVLGGDRRTGLGMAAQQQWLADAPAAMVFTAVYERTARRYGERAERYVHMEAGHAAENLHLQAVALGLGTVVVGAFDDDEVQRVLGLTDRERPLSIMPVGRPRR